MYSKSIIVDFVIFWHQFELYYFNFIREWNLLNYTLQSGEKMDGIQTHLGFLRRCT